MNAEEFLEKHFDVIRDAIGMYISHFEDIGESRAIESRNFPKYEELGEMAELSFRIASRGGRARDDLVKLAQQMGKL